MILLEATAGQEAMINRSVLARRESSTELQSRAVWKPTVLGEHVHGLGSIDLLGSTYKKHRPEGAGRSGAGRNSG